MLDPFVAAEAVLYPTWGALFTGVLALGSGFPWLAQQMTKDVAYVARLKPLCRKAAFIFCLVGWLLVPDTIAVEGREPGALQTASCRSLATAELQCSDGTSVARDGLVPHQNYAVHRLAFLGLVVAVEPE